MHADEGKYANQAGKKQWTALQDGQDNNWKEDDRGDKAFNGWVLFDG
jgi:hypothetical protein